MEQARSSYRPFSFVFNMSAMQEATTTGDYLSLGDQKHVDCRLRDGHVQFVFITK